jgi:hypothetical protein
LCGLKQIHHKREKPVGIRMGQISGTNPFKTIWINVNFTYIEEYAMKKISNQVNFNNNKNVFNR